MNITSRNAAHNTWRVPSCPAVFRPHAYTLSAFPEPAIAVPAAANIVTIMTNGILLLNVVIAIAALFERPVALFFLPRKMHKENT